MAVGDPQTTPETFFSVLDDAGVLGDDGFLRDDVGLVSMGDHFDFGGDAERARDAGPPILAWLAAHPSDQVVVLIGNHDAARVVELAYEGDASFAEARALAEAIHRGEAREDEFHARFPAIPTSGLARRDYAGFTESQRALVQRLLLEGRLALAACARLADASATSALLAHTVVTRRELALLGLDEPASADAIARAIQAHLRAALERVAPAWRAGERAALDLSPINVPGTTRLEGGGFLFHRPADPDRDGGARAWEVEGERPRRFDPRTLPRDLVQIVGHDPHEKRKKEMPSWTTARAEAAGEGHLRTLQVVGETPVYDLGVLPHVAGAATVYLVDVGLGHGVERAPLFPLGDLACA
jgi:hypothetical protein